MKIYIFLILLFSSAAVADVGLFFTDIQAVVVVQGQDEDATNLFKSIDLPPRENGNTLSKEIFVESSYGEPIFDLICTKLVFSKSTTCTIKFFAPKATINKERETALVEIKDKFEAHFVSNKFINGKNHSDVFRSLNGKLRIWTAYDNSGQVDSFNISYK